MAEPRLPLRTKSALFAHVWSLALRMELSIRTHPLPDVVSRTASTGEHIEDGLTVRRLRRAVDRTLKVAGWEPRCLVKALVLHRLLAERGIQADLVIGLPADARGVEAHAWVEVDGHDVGPRPGRSGHEELARYPLRNQS